MGEAEESSRSAAQSAQTRNNPSETTTRPKGNGLWRRLIGGGRPAQPALPPPQRAQHGMVNLRRMRVVDVALPKAEIIAVAADTTLDALIDVFRDSGLTRLPVYDETLDQPIGMVHLKDLALKHGFNNGGEEFDLQSILRPLLFVPPSMPLGVLLTKMQTERRHMALVIDEYGGTDGLVTIEDLIEQVVGDIEDEHDVEEDALWLQEKPGCWQVAARASVKEFEQEIGIGLIDYEGIDAEEIDTLGGLTFVLAGHVPARGEVVEHPSGASFEVMEADPRRVKRIRVRVPDKLNPSS